MNNGRCHACGASINGRFCSYCGTQVPNNDKTITLNKNININKQVDINKNYKYTDEAKVLKEKNKANEYKALTICVIALLLFISFLFIMLANLPESNNDEIEQSLGKISAGYYNDLIGKDFRTVEAHFKSAGFTNIELIDLDDSGLAFWNDGKVVSISVGGKTSFNESDWFYPDTKVVISYH